MSNTRQDSMIEASNPTVSPSPGDGLRLSQIDMGETWYRIHFIYAEVGGLPVRAGHTLFTGNTYTEQLPDFARNMDYWVWDAGVAFPTPFYMCPSSITLARPPRPPGALVTRQAASVFNAVTGNLPDATIASEKLFQLHRRPHPLSTTWTAVDAYLHVAADPNVVTWYAKAGEINTVPVRLLKWAEDETVKFVRVTVNPAVTTGFFKSIAV